MRMKIGIKSGVESGATPVVKSRVEKVRIQSGIKLEVKSGFKSYPKSGIKSGTKSWIGLRVTNEL